MTSPGGSQHAPAIGPREEEDGRDASIMQTRRIKPLMGKVAVVVFYKVCRKRGILLRIRVD